MRTLFAFCGIALASAALPAQDQKAGKLAPYYPTPQLIVDKMLQLGELKAGEKMFDLGSGDGRIVIAAAQKYKANATGVELDDSLARQSAERIRITRGRLTQAVAPAELLK